MNPVVFALRKDWWSPREGWAYEGNFFGTFKLVENADGDKKQRDADNQRGWERCEIFL